MSITREGKKIVLQARAVPGIQLVPYLIVYYISDLMTEEMDSGFSLGPWVTMLYCTHTKTLSGSTCHVEKEELLLQYGYDFSV